MTAAAGALALMGNAALAPRDRVYGLASDPLGEVWRLAQFDSGEIQLVGDGRSSQANAPSGVPLRRPADVSQILYDAPAAGLAKAVGPVSAYALLIFLAFWTTAVSGYVAARVLGLGPLGSALAGAMFTLTPVHMLEQQLHVGLAFVFMLPLLLVLGISVLERPSARRGVAFGAALGLCGYITAYLFLEAAALAVGIAAGAVVLAVRHRSTRPAMARAVGGSAVGLAALLAPLAVLLAVYGDELAPRLDRSVAEVAMFSFPLRAYLDPSSSLLGPVGLLLALAGLVAGGLSGTRRLVVGLVALGGLLVSLRPELLLFGVEIPMPSRLIHELVPYWRVFGRTAIVVALGGGILAGALVHRAWASGNSVARLAAVTIAALAIGDLVERPPRAAADLGRSDPVAEILHRGTGATAEYPLFGFENDALGPYLVRQLRHGRPLHNGSFPGTRAADLANAAATASAPEAREALTLAGVSTIVVHPGSPEPPTDGFRLLGRADGASIYAVTPAVDPVIATVRGAYPPEQGPDGSPFQWLGEGASLRVASADRGPVNVELDAVSPEVPRTVSFGNITRNISTGPTRVRLCVIAETNGTATLPIAAEPPARSLPGGDARVAALGVYHLRARRGCR